MSKRKLNWEGKNMKKIKIYGERVRKMLKFSISNYYKLVITIY